MSHIFSMPGLDPKAKCEDALCLGGNSNWLRIRTDLRKYALLPAKPDYFKTESIYGHVNYLQGLLTAETYHLNFIPLNHSRSIKFPVYLFEDNADLYNNESLATIVKTAYELPDEWTQNRFWLAQRLLIANNEFRSDLLIKVIGPNRMRGLP